MILSALHRKLVEDGTKLFSDRQNLDSFWQQAALAFYPEMADFTSTLPSNRDFAGHLTSSYPLIARRTLGDSLSALLRPVSLDTTSPGVWFSMKSSRGDSVDVQGKKWLERATKIQRAAMYDRKAKFVRATKEGDHSFATFGQCVIRMSMNRMRDTLLYRNCHLKDVVWCEDAEGDLDMVQYRWRPTAQQLAATFPGKVSPKVKEKLDKAPYETVECRHIVISAETYNTRDLEGKRYRTPWISIWVDVANNWLLEEVGSASRVYIIPRWVTVPGSQYATSPCVTAALPDSRLLQAVALTIMEAGEKYADPPLVATEEVIRSDMNTQSGGITWVDREYDEKMGSAIRPLYKPEWAAGMNGAYQINADIRQMIDKAFFLDSLSLPPANIKDMTAFEVGQRISEWIRRALPIFEPMEFEYNGALCEETFDLLMNNGGFGPWAEIPQSIRRSDVQFKFESPLHENADRRKGQKFMEAVSVLGQAAQMDQSVLAILDARTGARDALDGIGIPADWTRDDDQVDQLNQAKQQQEQMAAALSGAGAASEVANNLGSAAKNFAGAMAA